MDQRHKWIEEALEKIDRARINREGRSILFMTEDGLLTIGPNQAPWRTQVRRASTARRVPYQTFRRRRKQLQRELAGAILDVQLTILNLAGLTA